MRPFGQHGVQNAIHDISPRDIRHFGPVAKVALNPSAKNVDTKFRKPPVFPASQFPTDIANVALRDADDARERYLAKRFQLTRHFAALLAERAFHVEARQ